MASLILAGVVVALVAVLLWERRHAISAWWTARREPPYDGDECEVCGHRGADNVTLGAVTKRPEFGGASGITATFCPEHLPAEHRSR